MRSVASALLVAGSVLLLSACDPKNDEDDLSGTPITVPEAFGPLFDPSSSIIPFPSNLLFSGSTDGTLNIPVDDPADLSDPQVALNALDGFSTIAPMSAGFSGPIDPATVNGTTVRVFEATIDRATTAVAAIGTELNFLADFFATVSSLDDSSLVILPLRPLKANQGYVVVLTRGIQSTGGDAAVPDTTYALARLPSPPDLPPEQAAALEPLRQLINAQDAALEAKEPGLAASAALAWSFTTQTIGEVLAGTGGVRDLVAANADITSEVAPVPIDALIGGAAPASADIYVGTLTLPYYLDAPSVDNPTAILSTFWTGPTGGNLTGLVPGVTNVPTVKGTQTIPLWISVPTGVKPAGGWPVLIYQHGITNSRSTLLAIAEALATAATPLAVVAIDLPLHGLLPSDPLRLAEEGTLSGAGIALPTQRTFDVDYVTQDPSGAITAQTPDMVTDSSGRHFLNLSSLLTARDNTRQAVADLFALYKELPNIDYDGDGNAGGPDFNTDAAGDVRFAGWSLGAIVGSVFLALEPDVGASVLAMPGGGIAKLLDGSASFGPEVAAGLAAAAGIMRGEADFEAFLAAAQTVIDTADPLNYASPALGTPGDNQGTTNGGARGVMMFEVVGDGAGNLPDQTIPNNVGTLAMGFMDAPPGIVPSPTAGTDPLRIEMGLVPVAQADLLGAAPPGTSTQPLPLLRFTAGYHGSFVDPALSPTADPDTTDVMQTAMGDFLANNGAMFDVSGTNYTNVVE